MFGKIPFFENELRSSENFRSGFQIFRLGVLAEKWQLAACACVLLYEKQSLLYELILEERAILLRDGRGLKLRLKRESLSARRVGLVALGEMRPIRPTLHTFSG